VRILLVEDEFLIRLMLLEEFEYEGFEVCEAEDADRAAAVLENGPAGFDVLVTDIHMPGRLNGMELARRMRERYPTTFIIYITGRPEVLSDVGGLGPRETLVRKPFTPSQVLSAIRQFFGHGPATIHG
jgi:DNA-binding response OmpR family regulator